jgi:hypothetical protein
MLHCCAPQLRPAEAWSSNYAIASPVWGQGNVCTEVNVNTSLEEVTSSSHSNGNISWVHCSSSFTFLFICVPYALMLVGYFINCTWNVLINGLNFYFGDCRDAMYDLALFLPNRN